MFLFGLQQWISPHSQFVAELVLGKIWLKVVFQLLLNLWPITGFQLDQFLHEHSIFVVLIGCIHPPYNRAIAAFSHIGPYNFPCFQKGHISLMFHLKYSLSFLVNISRSFICWMIVSAVCTSNFFQAIFLHVVQVLFITFGTHLSSSTGHSFNWMSTILFIVPKSCKRDYIYCFLWQWFPTGIASRNFSMKLTWTPISNAFVEKISSTKLYYIATKDICTTHHKESDIFFWHLNLYFVSFILTTYFS